MRTRTQRLEDRSGLIGASSTEVTLELCHTLDDASERIAEKLVELTKLTDAIEALIEALRREKLFG